ncbi:Armadillo-type fold [Plasmopara halstedii]|uniref:Armadillo-type fold n=1 Tax=Plasmopara halstedii TaxID=4781 RepID=A0A0P1AFM8_PLAHL|nr:Armadillo-type fold [Plasmopara halstedii]CEG39233.1 Armadillo-type fold [Plasmopara halstedii]|eukprot:XP_024575602.1 Armadillo-type fold [Plasmopara halstedii]
MLDTTAHMLLLLQQAKIKNEHPSDASFLPLSLSMACLLRQLPSGLAPPAGTLSFHQIDYLPQENLERKLANMVLDDTLRALTFVCSLVKYVRIMRKLLHICHDHISNRASTTKATHDVIEAVVEALSSSVADDSEKRQDTKRKDDLVQEVARFDAAQKLEPDTTPTTTAIGKDRLGIMRRALGRDMGDGSTVIKTMKNFIADAEMQSLGMRALKKVIRTMAADKISVDLSTTNLLVENEANDQNNEIEERSKVVIQTVIDKMKQFPESRALQRDGLLCLAEYANQSDGHIVVITSSGGISSLIHAMVALPDDIPANMAGLSVLAHPKIADESVVRVNPESRRLVLSAMERFPLNEKLQGLSCLALANLSLRQDASMVEIVSKGGLEIVVENMKRFSSTASIQAAGCWLIAIISGKSDEMKVACLDAGALPACERARLRFPQDRKVQQHAVRAIQTILPGELIEDKRSSTSDFCSVQ